MTDVAPNVVDARSDLIRWATLPYFMLRAGGLPFDLADSLRFDRTAAWAVSVLELETDLEHLGRELGDVLERSVAACVGQPVVRQRLINLRRDVFNQRRPKDKQAIGLGDALGPESSLLQTWLLRLERLDSLRTEGRELLAVDLCDCRDLQNVCAR